MNIKQIVSIVIAIFIAIGIGIGVYLFFVLKGLPSQQAPVTNTQNTSGDTSVNIPNPTQVQSGTVQSQQQIDAAYVTLFGKIGAQKVKFNSVSSSAGESGAVYALYSADIAAARKMFPKLTSFPMNIALIDLNGDAVNEAVVWENLPGLCGSAGCPLELYTKVGGKWSQIYTGFSGSNVGLGASNGGYADLFSAILGDDVGYESKIVKYSWDGAKYAPNGVVATWDGSQFVY